MAEKLDRDVQRILGNQGWLKSALGELLTNNATIITNQATQIARFDSIITLLEAIRDQHSTDEEALLALEDIRMNIEFMREKM